MYDPLLHLMIHNLIHQLFKHLLGEIREFGVKIIYAHSDKLILSTGKDEILSAQSHCDFIMNKIKESSTLNYLSLECIRY